jgi:hypothetical protein
VGAECGLLRFVRGWVYLVPSINSIFKSVSLGNGNLNIDLAVCRRCLSANLEVAEYYKVYIFWFFSILVSFFFVNILPIVGIAVLSITKPGFAGIDLIPLIFLYLLGYRRIIIFV